VSAVETVLQQQVATADARALALELAAVRPATQLDPVALGVVLRPGESALRAVGAGFAIRLDGWWTPVEPVVVVVTTDRLLVRFAGGELAALWWAGVMGLEVDVVGGRLVLDYGDGAPRTLLGAAVAVLAVAAVWAIYGAEALLTHPDLATLRQLAPTS